LKVVESATRLRASRYGEAGTAFAHRATARQAPPSRVALRRGRHRLRASRYGEAGSRGL